MSDAAPNSVFTRSLRLRRVVLALGWLVIVATWGGPWSWLQPLEGLALDQRFQLRRRLQPPNASAPLIVGINDSSFTLAERAPDLIAADPALARLQASWPWNRAVFADVVRGLRAAGAKLIVFDIVCAGSNPGDADLAAARPRPGHWVAVPNCASRSVSTIVKAPIRSCPIFRNGTSVSAWARSGVFEHRNPAVFESLLVNT